MDIAKELDEAELIASGSGLNHGCLDCSLSGNTAREAAEEIRLLRKAVSKYCDNHKMATVHDMSLQQAIDRAFEFTES